jgi:steroid delta-isomerase-like uncharacterized protein
MEESNKKLIYFENKEIGNKGNLDLIPEIFTKDIVRHFLPDGSKTVGLDELRSRIDHHRNAFPDWKEEIKLIVAENDLVAIYFTSSGTNTGSFFNNPPTGKKIYTNDFSIFRIVDDKIIEQWLLPDLFSLHKQLEQIPNSEANVSFLDSKPLVNITNSDNDTFLKERNKELVILMNEQVWTNGNLDNIEDFFSSDFTRYFLPFGSKTIGLEDFHEHVLNHRKAFPDWSEKINLVVAEGEYVVIQFTSTGTNTGSFLGNPPTGKQIRTNEMSVFRLLDGKIVEQWLLPDLWTLNQQLGID